MYCGEKSLVVDDLIALVNSNGQMMPKQRLSDEHRDVKPQKSAEEAVEVIEKLQKVGTIAIASESHSDDE